MTYLKNVRVSVRETIKFWRSGVSNVRQVLVLSKWKKCYCHHPRLLTQTYPHEWTLASSEKCLCCVSNCGIKIFPLSFISSSVFTFLPSSSCTSPQSEKFLTYLCILSTLDIARVLPPHSQSRVQKVNFAPDWFFSGFFLSPFVSTRVAH